MSPSKKLKKKIIFQKQIQNKTNQIQNLSHCSQFCYNNMGPDTSDQILDNDREFYS